MIATRTATGVDVTDDVGTTLTFTGPAARVLGVLAGGPLPLGPVTKRASTVSMRNAELLAHRGLVTITPGDPLSAELTELGAAVAAAITAGAR